MRWFYPPQNHFVRSDYPMQVGRHQSLFLFHLTKAKTQHFDNDCLTVSLLQDASYPSMSALEFYRNNIFRNEAGCSYIHKAKDQGLSVTLQCFYKSFS